MSKKILVVDDEPDILRVVVFRLKKMGYEVFSATTGKEAFSLIKEQKPDLMLLDFRLPDTDGIEISKWVRKDEELKNTPIILISASSGPDILALVKEATVNEYVSKPFDPDDLLAKIQKYF